MTKLGDTLGMSQIMKRISIFSILLLPCVLYFLLVPSSYHVIQEDSEQLLAAEKSVDGMIVELKNLQKAIIQNATRVDTESEHREILNAEAMPPLPNVPSTTSQDFPRLLGRGDHQTVLKLLSILDEIVESVGGKLIMYYGTLLGSYICHDILPWDDDVDFLVTVSSKEDLGKKLREGKNGTLWDIGYRMPNRGTLKVWFKDSPHAGKFNWKFPFVDIWFLDYNTTNVWSYDERGFNIPIDEFFPLHKRPLGHIYLNSPHKARSMLKNRYKLFKCVSHFWDHRNEHGKKQVTVPCKELKKHYPHVLRHQLPHGVKETLVIDGKPFYSLNISEEYDGYVAPFSFDAL